MILLTKIASGAAGFLFDTRLGQACAAGLVIAGLVTWFAFDQRARGAAGALVNVEQSNAAAIKTGKDAGARSRDPKSRGVRDPYTVAH